jgi:Sulfotransferase family
MEPRCDLPRERTPGRVRDIDLAPPPGAPVIFVCGLHRSGTSIVHRRIADHPEVSGFHGTGVPEDEGQHLQSVYPPARRYGGPGLFGFDPDAHLTEESPLVSRESRDRLMRDWTPHWRPDARVRIEKSPPNIIRTRFLQALFPEAAFLVIVRHPVAVAGATRKWAHTSWTSLVRHWVTCHEIFLADAPMLRRVRVLRYEDFVAAPDSCLTEVFRWFGIEPHAGAEHVLPDVNRRYFAMWRRRGRVFGRIDRRLAAERYEQSAARWGYSMQDPGFLGQVDPLLRAISIGRPDPTMSGS